jgi:hypothetical protein
MADLPSAGEGQAAAELSSGTQPRSAAAKAEFVVEAATWAPSVHNTQPWLFSADGARITMFADAGRQLTVPDASGREMLISCGAALFNARLAVRLLGYLPETQVLPDPAQPLLIARLSWARPQPPTDYEQQLFRQVTRRRTHRGGFDPLPLSPEFLAVLAAGAARDGAGLRIIADGADRAILAAEVQSAEDKQHADSKYVQELATWVLSPGSMRRDGVPRSAYPTRPEHTVPDFPGRDFAHGRPWGQPRFGSASVSHSAGVACVLTSAQDRAVDWVAAGQSLQRLLLVGTTCGVAAAMHSQPLELAVPRELIRVRLCDGDYPQLVLRLGTVTQTAASIRRPLDSVLRLRPAEEGPDSNT